MLHLISSCGLQFKEKVLGQWKQKSCFLAQYWLTNLVLCTKDQFASTYIFLLYSSPWNVYFHSGAAAADINLEMVLVSYPKGL